MPLSPEQERECSTLKKIFNEKSKLSQREFVKEYGLGTPANLGQYLNGRRPLSLKIATTLANALNVKVEDFSPRLAKELASLQPDSVAPVSMFSMKKIPILSHVQAGLLTDVGQIPDFNSLIEQGDYIVVDGELPDGTFAMEIRGDSMAPMFRAGDIIVLDPTKAPRPGDFVVANHISPYSDTVEATFKKYRERGVTEEGKVLFELVPLNDDYPVIESEKEQCVVTGVLVEHRRKFR